MLNALTDSNVLAEDKLFATLDPVVRKITLSGGTEALLSDTVGFINKLPHDLVEAFKSTLEEVSNSDLILLIFPVLITKSRCALLTAFSNPSMQRIFRA